MHLSIRKSGKYQYVYFHESYRDPVTGRPMNRTIRSFGRLDLLLAKDPDVLDKLRSEVRQWNETKKDLSQSHALLTPASSCSNIFYGHTVFLNLWRKLHIESWLLRHLKEMPHAPELQRAAFRLTGERLLYPELSLIQPQDTQRFFPEIPAEDSGILLDTLLFLGENRKKLLGHIHRRASDFFMRNTSGLCLLLLPSGKNACCFCLLLDADRIPLDFQMIDESDLSVLLPSWIKKCKKKYQPEKLILTAHRKLLMKHIPALQKLSFISFVLIDDAAEIAGYPEKLKSWILCPDDYETFYGKTHGEYLFQSKECSWEGWNLLITDSPRLQIKNQMQDTVSTPFGSCYCIWHTFQGQSSLQTRRWYHLLNRTNSHLVSLQQCLTPLWKQIQEHPYVEGNLTCFTVSLMLLRILQRLLRPAQIPATDQRLLHTLQSLTLAEVNIKGQTILVRPDLQPLDSALLELFPELSTTLEKHLHTQNLTDPI